MATSNNDDNKRHPCSRLICLRRIGVPLLLATLISGCAIKRDQYDTPRVPMPEQYLAAANEIVGDSDSPAPPKAMDSDTPVPQHAELAGWQRLFGSQELNDLVDRALANNQDLQIAAQQVLQARARAIQGQAGQYPEVSLPIQFQNEAPKDGVGTVNKGGDVKSETTYQIGLDLEWRLDLWGERRSLAESADLLLWRAIFNHDDQARKLVADVVSAYVEYLALNDRMRIARETEAVTNNMLQSMEARLQSGDANIIDVEQQRTAVFTVRADMPEIELRRKQAANKLALLLGGAPEGLMLPDGSLQELLLPKIRPGVPSALLLQRPDVRAIEARLLAADANIDLARARVLPPLDLTAQGGYGSRYIDELFRPHTLFWNFIANLSATLFDAGRRSSEVEYSKAAHEEMVETYVQVVHAATLEVRTALQTIEQTRQRLALQQEATDAAKRAWVYSQIAYDTGGAIDYLTYLNTIRTYHRTLDDLQIFRDNAYQGYINLFSALGGGAPSRAAIPGKGQRPEQQPGSILVGPSKQLMASSVWLPSAGWDVNNSGKNNHQPHEEDRETWLVELTGIHTREGVEATWRDLRNRNASQVRDRALLAWAPSEIIDSEGQAATWYRLAVEEFPSRDEAEQWCKQLNAGKMRCQVIAFNKESRIAGRFPWPDPKEDHRAQPAASAEPKTTQTTPKSRLSGG